MTFEVVSQIYFCFQSKKASYLLITQDLAIK
jgi:hypothetical protein